MTAKKSNQYPCLNERGQTVVEQLFARAGGLRDELEEMKARAVRAEEQLEKVVTRFKELEAYIAEQDMIDESNAYAGMGEDE